MGFGVPQSMSSQEETILPLVRQGCLSICFCCLRNNVIYKESNPNPSRSYRPTCLTDRFAVGSSEGL